MNVRIHQHFGSGLAVSFIMFVRKTERFNALLENFIGRLCEENFSRG